MRDTLLRPGIWRRAGMNGTPAGLDLNEALSGLMPGCDRNRARELFLIAEVHFLQAYWRAHEKQKD